MLVGIVQWERFLKYYANSGVENVTSTWRYNAYYHANDKVDFFNFIPNTLLFAHSVVLKSNVYGIFPFRSHQSFC